MVSGSASSREDVTQTEPSICGFTVRTREALKFLRTGGGDGALEIVAAKEPRRRPEIEPLADWTLPGTAHEARATLYGVDRGYEFWTSDVGAFHVDLDAGRIEIPESGDEIAREQRLWGVPLVLSYMHRGDFSLHAAAVDIGSGAVLFAAPSRYGKTTLAHTFHRRGFRLLSEDLACCRAGDSSVVLPGPALVRLRPDVYDGGVPPGMHVVAERPDRIFLALDDDRKGTSAPVPIKAIVFLREADSVRIEPVAAATALPDLWHLKFRLPTPEDRARSFEQLTRLANSAPCWNVYRPLRLDSLQATVEIIAERCK